MLSAGTKMLRRWTSAHVVQIAWIVHRGKYLCRYVLGGVSGYPISRNAMKDAWITRTYCRKRQRGLVIRNSFPAKVVVRTDSCAGAALPHLRSHTVFTPASIAEQYVTSVLGESIQQLGGLQRVWTSPRHRRSTAATRLESDQPAIRIENVRASGSWTPQPQRSTFAMNWGSCG